MIAHTAQESVFVLNPGGPEAPGTLDFHRFDLKGTSLLKKQYAMALPPERDGFTGLVQGSLAGYEGQLRDACLLVHPVNGESPEAILMEENYRELNRLKKRIFAQL